MAQQEKALRIVCFLAVFHSLHVALAFLPSTQHHITDIDHDMQSAPQHTGEEIMVACSAWTQCDACTSNLNCVWCPASSTCLDASADSSCAPSDQAGPLVVSISKCACVNPTTTFTNCSSCTRGDCPGNGWCPSEGKCFYGSSYGPANHTCLVSETKGQWTSESEACSCIEPNSSFTNCSSCLSLQNLCYNLGWCPSEGQCFYGSSSGPANHTCLVSDTKGRWTYQSEEACSCTEPSASYTNCSSCLAQNAHLSCSNGWCPSEGKCYYGSYSGPANHTCLASDTQGPWTSESEACSCTEPSTSFTNCSACIQSECSSGWCPSEQRCFYGSDMGPANHTCAVTATSGFWTWSLSECDCTDPTDSIKSCSNCTKCPGLGWCPATSKCYVADASGKNPENNTVCPASIDLGLFSQNCDCVDPIFIPSETQCLSCTTSHNFTWCTYAQICKTSLNGTNPCPDQACPSTCLCLSGSAQCVACAAGLTGLSSGCSRRCHPKCFDCAPDNPDQCLTQCAAGFTGFPDCVDICPDNCLSCGNSSLNANQTKFNLPTQCITCANPAAIPPHCDDCIPYVCHGLYNTCSIPCDLRTAPAFSLDVLSNAPSYPGCDSCKDAAEGLQELAQTLSEALETEEAAEAIAAEAELACLAIPFPPISVACSFAVATVETGSVAVAIVTWILDSALHKILASGFCMATHQCPFPCSPDRSSKLVHVARRREHHRDDHVMAPTKV